MSDCLHSRKNRALYACRASAAAILAYALATVVEAQSPAPGPHWGANVFPRRKQEFRATFSLNRFTEFSSTGKKFNAINETSGFNIFSLSYTDQLPYIERLPGSPNFSFTMIAGIGATDDQPTRALQNDFLHDFWGLDRVPVGESRSATDFVAGASLTYWLIPDKPWFQKSAAAEPVGAGVQPNLFVGGGFDVGTLYQESYFHLGGGLDIRPLRMRLALLHRIGFPRPGEAFSEVADFGNLSQLYIAYVPAHIESANFFMQWFGNPEVGLTITHDTGLFVDNRDNPIDTWFVSGRVEWATGLMFEMWNDVVNGSDFGPTMGLMLSVDLVAFMDLIKSGFGS